MLAAVVAGCGSSATVAHVHAAAGATPTPTAAPRSRPRTTLLGCGYRADMVLSSQPGSCFLGWPNLALAEAIYLRRLHWRHWGTRAATATAVFRTKTYDPETRVRVRADGRRSCGRRRVYTRVVVYGPGDTVNAWETPGCQFVA